MRQRRKLLLAVIAGLALAVVCFARTSKFTGKMVAYDLMHHAAKATSDTQNQEIVILELEGQKQRYAKVTFSSFGTTQIDPKYFDGTQPLEVDVLRDRGCDEKAPTFVPKVSLEQIAGTYLLTDAFREHPPGRIKFLECYDAIYKKKK